MQCARSNGKSRCKGSDNGGGEVVCSVHGAMARAGAKEVTMVAVRQCAVCTEQ